MLMLEGAGSEFQAFEYVGFVGARNKVIRVTDHSLLRFNRSMAGGDNLCSDIIQGQNGGILRIIRSGLGGAVQDVLTMGDAVNAIVQSSQVAGGRNGAYCIGINAGVNLNTSQISAVVYGLACDLGTIAASDTAGTFIENSWRATRRRDGEGLFRNLPNYHNIADATTDLIDAASPGPYLGGTAAANQLQNYDAPGSFTPNLLFGGAASGMTYTRRNGYYARIGNIVFVQIDILLSAKGSSTGFATITGLPIAAAAAPTFQMLPVLGGVVDLNAGGGYTAPGAYLAAGATVINMVEAGDAVAVTNLTEADFANNTLLWISGFYMVD